MKEEFNFEELKKLYAENAVTSDDLIKYVPREMPIDGDDCVFDLTMEDYENNPQYVVTYTRPIDNWICMTFTAPILSEVLYETIKYAYE